MCATQQLSSSDGSMTKSPKTPTSIRSVTIEQVTRHHELRQQRVSQARFAKDPSCALGECVFPLKRASCYRPNLPPATGSEKDTQTLRSLR